MTRKQCPYAYDDITSVENLLSAWQEFIRGKRNKPDVQQFQWRLMDNILALHRDLKSQTYRHGAYHAFKISDPKPRDIHKASVRDRLVHHAIHRVLYQFFDHTFIDDSYSCRVNKGTHRAMNRLREYAYTVSQNHTRTCWVLKCDVKKFFASIDQQTLFEILACHIHDERTQALIMKVVRSFHSTTRGKGLPLGNLTSQLFVNIYMNEFDQYVKHKLKTRYYIRYADDFVILARKKSQLESLVPQIADFLEPYLKLTLHPRKVSIATFASGIDFLGWVHFPDHRVLRTSTRRRAVRNCAGMEAGDPVVRSYLGLSSHGRARGLRNLIRELGKVA